MWDDVPGIAKCVERKIMKDRVNVVIATIGSLLFAFLIAVGMGFFGYGNKCRTNLVEVKGLSEKTVRADIGEIFISVSNNGFTNLEDLYKKRTEDRKKVLDFLKTQGVTEDEIANGSSETSDYNESDKTISATGVTKVDRKTFFRSSDTICVKTTQLEKIEKIRSEIIQLSSQNVLFSYRYNYRLTRFIEIKLEMMKEASENAYRNAQKFVEPYNSEIKEVAYLRQGEITIRAEDENEQISSWESQESKSINKKLRLVVRAGFIHAAKKVMN